MENLSLQKAFEEARIIAKNTSPKATFILDRFVSKDKREYLNLCYAYLRWVDDFIDDPEIPLSEKRTFANRQKSLIESYKNNFIHKPRTIEEYFLYYFIEFAVKNDSDVLIDSVYQMVDTISWDIDRLEEDGAFTKEQLNNYINIQSESFFNILYFFSTEKGSRKHLNNYSSILNTMTRLYMIRDLKEDIDTGFINISKEDIMSYNLDINNLKTDKNLSLWIEDQIRDIINALYDESTKLKMIPIKMRIFHFYSNFYYLPKIIRYKVYGYYVGSHDNRNAFKEMETFWQSFLISLKLFNNIFIKRNNDYC